MSRWGFRHLALLCVLALSAILPSAAHAATPQVNVRDYGALGNGTHNDTTNIQNAETAIAKTGGRLYFPPGLYIASDIWIDSNVEFYGPADAVIRHPNGVSPATIVKSRRTSTTGRIPAGSNIVHMTSVARVTKDTPIAILGAGGGSQSQQTTLKMSMPVSGGMAQLTQTSGFPTGGITLLKVDNEIISYNGIVGNTLRNLVRGRSGTVARAHAVGAPVSLLVYKYFNAVSVNGYDVTLDAPASFGVSGAKVYVGTHDTAIRSMTLDGNRPTSSTSAVETIPVQFFLTRRAVVQNATVARGRHGAVVLDLGSRDGLIDNNSFPNDGTPATQHGAAVWIFRGSNHNTVSNNTINGSAYRGIFIDDRTQTPSEWDGTSDDNVVTGNSIDIPAVNYNVGITVVGGTRNVVTNNTITNTQTGISVERSEQGLQPVETNGNTVNNNTLSNHRTAIRVTGSYNTFLANTISNCLNDYDDQGTGNVIAP